jgi:hypothetical protein
VVHATVAHRAANATIGVLTIIAGTADIMAAATHVAMPTIGVMTAEVMQGAVILVMAVRDNAPSMGCPPIVAILAMEAIADFAAIKV